MNTLSFKSRTPGVTKLFEILEKGFVVLALLLYSGAVLALVRFKETGGISDPIAGDPVMQSVYITLYVLTLFLLLLRWKRFIYVATRDKLLLLLIGLALVSVVWSVAPEITLRRSAALVGTTLFGVYLATRYSLREQLRLLAWTLGIAVLLSLLFVAALPSYAVYIDERGEALQGAFTHKNTLGRLMGLAAVVFLLFFFSDRRYRWVTGGGFVLSVGLLLLSTSATALVAFLLLLLLVPLYRALRGRYGSVAGFLIAGVGLCGGIVMWLLGAEDVVLAALGRTSTLTGRTDLWSLVLDMIWQRPWVGYGFGGFWLGWQGESAHIGLAYVDPRYRSVETIPPHAHNGFLDLWLDLGLLGLSVFALGFLSAVSRALAWLKSTKAAEGVWPLVFLSFVLIYSMSESTALRLNSVFWILYVATLLSTFAVPAKRAKGSALAQPKAYVGAVDLRRQRLLKGPTLQPPRH